MTIGKRISVNIERLLRQPFLLVRRLSFIQHLENVKDMLLQVSDADDPSFDGFLFSSVPSELNE